MFFEESARASVVLLVRGEVATISGNDVAEAHGGLTCAALRVGIGDCFGQALLLVRLQQERGSGG